MQLGFTLSEKMVFADGQLPTRSSPTTRSPASSTSRSMMTNEAVAARQDSGPFGAKGVGETGRSAYRRRSPTRSRTRSACASPRCRSPPRRSARDSRRRRRSARRTNDVSAAPRTLASRSTAAPARLTARRTRRWSKCCATVRPRRRARKLRPGPVRLLHGAGQRRGGVGLPVSRVVRRRRDGRDGRGLGRRAKSSIRCRKPSSRPAHSNADSARPVSS